MKPANEPGRMPPATLVKANRQVGEEVMAYARDRIAAAAAHPEDRAALMTALACLACASAIGTVAAANPDVSLTAVRESVLDGLRQTSLSSLTALKGQQRTPT